MTFIITVIVSVALSYILWGRRKTVTWKEIENNIEMFFEQVQKIYGDNTAEIKKLKQKVYLLSEEVNKKKNG